MKEKIPEIAIKIGDKTFQTNHQEEIQISRETLDQNMIEHSSLYCWYAVLEAELDGVIGDRKLELEVTIAKLYDHHRAKALEKSERVTDTRIDSAVKQDEKYIKAVLALNEARKNFGIFRAIVRAFEHRKEMLTNLGHKIRKEMEGEVIIKERK